MLGLVLALLLQPSAIQVEAEPMAGCALSAGVRAGLERVLPGLEILEAPQASVPDDLFLTVRRAKKRLKVQLTNAAGRVLLQRRVSAKRRSCAATVDTIVLMVERYLLDLGWEPMSPVLPASIFTPPSLPPRPDVPETEPPSRPKPVVEEETPGPPAQVPWWRGTTVGVSALTEISRSRLRWRGGAGASVAVPVRRVELRIELGGFGPHTKPVVHLEREVGTYRIWSVHGTAGVGACWPAPQGPRGCGALLFGAEAFFVSASGERVIDESLSVSVVPTGSLAVRFATPLWSETWGLFVGIATVLRPATDTFRVEGAASSYTPASLAFWGRLGLSGCFF